MPDYPHLYELSRRLVALWPKHERYVERSLEGRSPETKRVSDDLARIIYLIAETVNGGVDKLILDYQFLCEKITFPEEIYFRRHKKYRLSRFADAERECYANAPLMERYMNGVIVSGIFWSNHAEAFGAFVNDYLPRLPRGADHLEIGPGHGALLHWAAARPEMGRIEGWDVSPTSIANTRAALTTMGIDRPVELRLGDLFDTASTANAPPFDSVVMSEVIEHTEDPVGAMRAAASHLKPGGLLWINVPANSPMPDHIYLVESPEHARRLVEEAGMEVVDVKAFPMTGQTLDQAIRRQLTLNCIVLGRKPVH